MEVQDGLLGLTTINRSHLVCLSSGSEQPQQQPSRTSEGLGRASSELD
jgi:hypothetical protein